MAYGYAVASVKASVYGNGSFSGTRALEDALSTLRRSHGFVPYLKEVEEARAKSENDAVSLFRRLNSMMSEGDILSEYARIKSEAESSGSNRENTDWIREKDDWNG